jgi:SAM-dependent methyltransferase
MAKSVEFTWNPDDFTALIRSCLVDDGVQLAMQYLPDKNYRILEAGCGIGRVVKYLHDQGYQSVQGIELNEAAVRWVKGKFPELNITTGDLLNMPYESEYFDVLMSFGVVEHFQDGLDAPLKSLLRVLKVGGIAIVTVPSVNTLRKISYAWNRLKERMDPRRNTLIRRAFGKRPISQSPQKRPPDLYRVFPEHGPFFEYRLTRKEFESCCQKAGFKILRSVPISHLDGFYHQFGPRLIRFENWAFTPTRTAKALNAIFKLIPFFHNHMHACVLTKTSYSKPNPIPLRMQP